MVSAVLFAVSDRVTAGKGGGRWQMARANYHDVRCIALRVPHQHILRTFRPAGARDRGRCGENIFYNTKMIFVMAAAISSPVSTLCCDAPPNSTASDEVHNGS